MSRKTHVKHNDPFINPVYVNWLNLLCELISPKDLILLAGRGAAKTDIFAQRSQNVMYDMPGSQQVIVSDTYVNARKNILPTLLEGWERKGWYHGRDFVTDTKPPLHFKKCYKNTDSYRQTISTKVGVRLLLGSLDQPSGLAGNSFQHMFGDEGRLLDFNKLKKLDPAIRGGDVRFQSSVYYRGRTFLSDNPNILQGDYDWMLNREKDMNIEQIKAALECGKILNEIKCELYNAQMDRNEYKANLLLKQIARWTEKWIRVRKDSTFFYMVSSMVNADILQEGFFKDTFKALGPEEFKTAILGFKADIKKGEKFYGTLGEHHYYDDGVITEYYHKYSLMEEIEESSLALRHIDHNAKLEGGMDFGDMCSLVAAQPRGNYLYCLKEFYTLAPENEIQMGLKFCEFFKHHKVKVLDLYYDRSGNQNSKTKRDWANAIKKAIEYNNGSSTGWTVNLKSEGQSTIYHEEEYNFAKNLFGERTRGLIKIKIDKFQCKCLKSSLELTKIKIRTDTKTGSKSLHKDKSTESLPLASRPMFSTNFSDAFKYLVYRPAYVKLVNTHSGYSGMDPSVGG
ncbi:hypothetical protein AAGV28_07080 [Flavobacterium sp. FZUC8N2.13]|uniref:Terminase-like family protein n=1 Tax=Flavobacterium zubiriense TaxID=3138075 RepID=A0ABV4TDU4_9FLAO